ncbi:MAG TPA: lysophospholipid acyltransferase family protein [Actinomycetota bacterium]|nr:lysophospholipid acyltransferase family protein [Actinomycetota bacterium]
MELAYGLVVWTIRPLFRVLFRWRMTGMEFIPQRGPAIFACNHISYLDPLAQGYVIVRRRIDRLRFFAKAELWKNPFLRLILKSAKQIPVERGSGEAGPVEGALNALRRGDAVVIYPEATITTTPDLSPMRGKTGVARVAVASGAPVIPVAIWGSHWVSPKNRVRTRRLFRTIFVAAGEPMSFASLRGREDDPTTLRDVTDRIMGELERLVRDLQKDYPGGAAVPPPLPGREAA